MGWIQKRPDRPGYVARWKDPDGNRRSKTFRTKSEALRFLAQTEASKIEGDYVDPRRSKMTVAEWAVEFTRLRTRRRPGTVEREQGSLRAHVLPALGKRAMGSVRRADIQQYVDHLATLLAPSTVVREYAFLHVFFQEAVDMDPPVIARNPCRKIALPERDEREQRFFTPEEVRAIYDVFDPRYKAMVLVGCFAGLRIGEQAALRTSDVLFGHGEIFVRQGAFEPKAGPVQIGPLKTRYSRGRVDVPQFLLDELSTHLKAYPPAVAGSAQGFVFPSPDGEPLRPRNWRRRYWDRAVKTADIDPATPHAMRHTFVSFLIDQGLPVEKVAEQARHRDPGFTWRVYRHRFERRASEGYSEAAVALQNVWAAGVTRGQSGGQRGDGWPLRTVPSSGTAGESAL